MTLVEICVEDPAEIALARAGGAQRVELCREVSCGGLTPSDEAVAAALEVAPAGGLQILVRPRPGDFIHSAEEIAAICADVERLHRLTENASVPVGFVVGVLRKDLTIHEDAAARMREAAGERPLTFHRAFDQVPDISSSLETLIRLGYDRVLTTGGHPSVAQYDVLSRMVSQVGEELIILGSGGLRAHNVARAITAAGLSEVHMRAPGHEGRGTDQQLVAEIMSQVRQATALRG